MTSPRVCSVIVLAALASLAPAQAEDTPPQVSPEISPKVAVKAPRERNVEKLVGFWRSVNQGSLISVREDGSFTAFMGSSYQTETVEGSLEVVGSKMIIVDLVENEFPFSIVFRKVLETSDRLVLTAFQDSIALNLERISEAEGMALIEEFSASQDTCGDSCSSPEAQVMNNLRIVASAGQQYLLETGEETVSYSKLVELEYCSSLDSSHGEDYSTLVITPNTTFLEVTLEDGTPVRYDF